MKQSITVSQFDDAFVNMGRQDQFSYEARHALYEFIEELDEDCGTETELDVIALCCEFTEYADLAEFNEAYSLECETLADVNDHTLAIAVGDESFIIQDF